MEIPPADLKFTIEPGSARAVARAGKTATTDMLMVPPAEIHIMEGFNLRVTGTKRWKDRVEFLANSIETEGFYKDEPLSCYVGKDDTGADRYFLVKGHCRMAAIALLAEKGKAIPERVPVVLKPPGTSAEDLTVDLFKTGQDLTTYEKALGVKRLDGMGFTPEEIRKRTGVTKRYADELRALLGLPLNVRRLLAEDRISGSEAMAQVREKGQTAAAQDIEAAAEAIDKAPEESRPRGKKAADGRITRGTIERVAARKEASAERTPRAPRDGAIKLNFTGKPGQVVPLSEIALFQTLYGGDWFDHGEEQGTVRIMRRVQFKLAAYRKPPEPTPNEPDTQGL